MKQAMSASLKVGDWTYDERTLVVRYQEGTSHEYEVDLEKCLTSAEMLDWIFQFGNKGRATRESVGDLVEILNRLLHPQQTLCSRGEERGPLPTGNALRNRIANHIREREVVDRWEQGLKAKQGTDFIIIGPKDWEELARMEREAG